MIQTYSLWTAKNYESTLTFKKHIDIQQEQEINEAPLKNG